MCESYARWCCMTFVMCHANHVKHWYHVARSGDWNTCTASHRHIYMSIAATLNRRNECRKHTISFSLTRCACVRARLHWIFRVFFHFHCDWNSLGEVFQPNGKEGKKLILAFWHFRSNRLPVTHWECTQLVIKCNRRRNCVAGRNLNGKHAQEKSLFTWKHWHSTLVRQRQS